ncbi:hypothetical protein COB55_03205 [Candidatus Wolfebacteria bacterium]|nr:MAG: hypothetical protein COB55_03205 [Candidatus Wolfebacteria bacterium]
MAIVLVPNGGLVIDNQDNETQLFPNFGLFTNSPPPKPALTLPTQSNITQTTATIGITTDLVVNGALHWYISLSATAPDDDDLLDGSGSFLFGNTSSPIVGINTFDIIGLIQGTTYYTYFLQTSDNGNSNKVSSIAWPTLSGTPAPSTNPIYASAIASAIRLIDIYGQTATLLTINDAAPIIPSQKWKPGGQTNIGEEVRMAFFNETRVDQYGETRQPGQMAGHGFEYGLLADNDIEPTLKHVIIKEDSSEWKIRYINRIHPSGEVIMYKIGISQ